MATQSGNNSKASARISPQWRSLAQQRCDEMGERLIPARLGAYAELHACKRALTAYELIAELETRLEFTHKDFLGFDSATAIQLSNRQFSAIGEEAFVQPVDTRTLGLFYVGQRSFGSLALEAGIRYL